MSGHEPTYDELARRVGELTDRLDGLERRNHGGPSSSVSRRGLLRAGAVTGVGAVAGAVFLAAPAAHGASGNPVLMGAANDSDATSTSLASTTGASVLVVSQNGGGGDAVKATVPNGTGSAVNASAGASSTSAVLDATQAGSGAVLIARAQKATSVAAAVVVNNAGKGSGIVATNSNTANTQPAVQGTSAGAGFAVYGLAAGTGRAVAGYVAHTANASSAVYGATAGSGAGVEGKSANGRGGKFTGRYAQINLVPGTSTTHPSHGGVMGDLYADLSGRLWFCRGNNAWVQVV